MSSPVSTHLPPQPPFTKSAASWYKAPKVRAIVAIQRTPLAPQTIAFPGTYKTSLTAAAAVAPALGGSVGRGVSSAQPVDGPVPIMSKAIRTTIERLEIMASPPMQNCINAGPSDTFGGA